MILNWSCSSALNKKIVVLLVFCNFFFGLIAQSDNAVREAIKKSYDSEYQLKYQKAIEDFMRNRSSIGRWRLYRKTTLKQNEGENKI